MFVWLTLKMATSWNRVWQSPRSNESAEDQEILRLGAFSALQGGLVSMLFAMIGGLIWRREMWP